MSTRTPFKWNTANFSWESNPFPNQSVTPFTWDDVALVTEIIQISGGGGDYRAVQEVLEKDIRKKKRFITLLCKVKGYEETKETKEIKDYKIFISDIDMVVKEVMAKVELEL
jgi:hypothetical protein